MTISSFKIFLLTIFILQEKKKQEKVKNRWKKVTLDNSEEVINRIRHLKEIDVVQPEDFARLSTQVCVHIDKERAPELYQANCSTNDTIYT